MVFKGGTSLSKAFGLINRFSEDIGLIPRPDDLDRIEALRWRDAVDHSV
jgi:predicted nucleotidyltransferase component of viral defense system